jgi:hypothetical protein
MYMKAMEEGNLNSRVVSHDLLYALELYLKIKTVKHSAYSEKSSVFVFVYFVLFSVKNLDY